jgi:hypothetical protein
LLNWEGIQWAVDRGFKEFDFAAMSPRVAAALLRGDALAEAERKTRDFFNLGFGGRPWLLAGSCIYLRHLAGRATWSVLNRVPCFQRWARRLVSGSG